MSDPQGTQGVGWSVDEQRRARYLRAKPLAMAALERAAGEREAHVLAACAGDEALLDEVRWLLQAAEITTGEDGLVEGGLASPRATVDDSGATLGVAGHGAYRIVRRLGEGGSGVVYLAERRLADEASGDIRQQVALKLLHATDQPDPHVMRRFDDERRILATLAHPNIAHLIDGGSMADGRPFLALEYVHGERIDAWCAQRQLSLRQRVALFLKACAAVQYAHQRLVIHRDIKPANLLVTADGEPKLLDFGIARLLDQVGGLAGAPTQTVQRALTLAYASPEQLSGLPLGTGTDVWSLGVLLYQLVSDARPFDADAGSPLALTQAILAARVVPPSRHRVGLPADIDAIVLKALRREPGERYPSVDALADDLRRFLAAQPVRARQGQRWYHARLFVRRHRWGLAAAAMLVVLLAGWAFERQVQLQRVELARDRTQAIAGFLQNLFENADPSHAHGSHLTVREVLDRGAGQLMARHDIAAPVRVSLLLSMARSYNQLSLSGKALPLLTEARRLQQTYPADALERGEVLAALGRAYSTLIDLPTAIPLNAQAIDLLKQAPGDHAEAIMRVRINQLYNHLGVSDLPLAQIDQRVRAVLAALDAQRTPSPELHMQALAVLAMTKAAEGQDSAAVAAARRALDQAGKTYVADDPALVYYRFTLALVSMRADPAKALRLYQQAVVDYDRMVGTPGPGLAGLLAFFGDALGQAGQSAAAVPALQRAVRIAKGFATQSPDFYLGTCASLARQYLALGQPAQAEAVLAPDAAWRHQRAATGARWALDNAADALNLAGDIALRQGHPDAALADYEHAGAQWGVHARPASSQVYAASLSGAGEAALALGKPDLAAARLAQLDAFNQSARIQSAQASPDAGAVLDASLLRARLALVRGQRSEAERALAALPSAGPNANACDQRSLTWRRLRQAVKAADPQAVPLPACAAPAS